MGTHLTVVLYGKGLKVDDIVTPNSDSVARIANLTSLLTIGSDYVTDDNTIRIPTFHTKYIDYNASTTNEELDFLKTIFEDVSTGVYLILRDSAITSVPQDQIYQTISKALTLPSWRVFFLGKWLDSCQNYVQETTINDNNTNIVGGSIPQGFEAVLISQDGSAVLSDYITTTLNLNTTLSEAIDKVEDFTTFTTSPNVFSYDPQYDDSNTILNIKTQECISTVTDFTPVVNNDLLFFYLLVIIILVIVLCFFVFKYFYKVDVNIVKSKNVKFEN